MINIKTFEHALRGIAHALRTEKNLQIHMMLLMVVVILAFVLTCSPVEWALLLLCFSSVISLELMNTSIEKLCDKIESKHDEHIKLTKDIAASAVLFASLCSAIIGCIIFLPKLLNSL